MTADRTCKVQLTYLELGTGQSESDTWQVQLTSATQDVHVPAVDGLHTVHGVDSGVPGEGLWLGKRDQTVRALLVFQPVAAGVPVPDSGG